MTIACTDQNANRHYSIGNYYNWTAAVAMNDSSSYTGYEIDAGQSICPAGWMLPVHKNNKSYDNLMNGLGLIDSTGSNVQDAPVYFVPSGYLTGV